jgi:hypothetical protein
MFIVTYILLNSTLNYGTYDVHMCFEVLLRMSWGTLEEPFGNLIGTHTPLPPTHHLKTQKEKIKNKK